MGRKRKMTDEEHEARPLAHALDVILTYRRDLGTAAQVARRADNVTPQNLSDYRLGKTVGKLSVWYSICAAYGFRFDQFCRFAWDLQRGVPIQEALSLLFTDDYESNLLPKEETDFDNEMTRIFANIKQWWVSELDERDKNRDAASQFLSYITLAIPEFGKWYSRRNIIKNPAECGA